MDKINNFKKKFFIKNLIFALEICYLFTPILKKRRE